MNAHAIPPVVKTLRVEAPQERAFETFTAGLPRWWPMGAAIGKTPLRKVELQCRLGGHWLETDADGVELVIGTILAWEPPHRFVMSWRAHNRAYVHDLQFASELEVRFAAAGVNATDVELMHHKFEAVGPSEGARIRADVERGWPILLKFYAEEAARDA